MSEIVRDVSYAPGHGVRAMGDLHLATEPTGCPVLLIHGGGWNALSKESMEPLAHLFAEQGRSTFNINYRLLSAAPWPACRDDCVMAGRFVLAGGLAEHGLSACDRVLVCGASAGGHLAMMTGLGLPARHVEAIISLCGPSRIDFPDGSTADEFRSDGWRSGFLGQRHPMSAADIAIVSPSLSVRVGAPELFCIHSRNDRLVPPSHSVWAVEAWRAVGSRAALFLFDGPGDSHGIWDSEYRPTRRPIDDVVVAIKTQLARLNGASSLQPQNV